MVCRQGQPVCKAVKTFPSVTRWWNRYMLTSYEDVVKSDVAPEPGRLGAEFQVLLTVWREWVPASDNEVNRNRRVKIRREHRPANLMERTSQGKAKWQEPKAHDESQAEGQDEGKSLVMWAATAEEPQRERQTLSYSEMILSNWDSLVWLNADYFLSSYPHSLFCFLKQSLRVQTCVHIWA